MKRIVTMMAIALSLGAYAQGGISYVPVILTNSQTTPTPANFQQMIMVNSSHYIPFDSSGLQNVEFSTGPGATGTVLQAWIEKGAIDTSTNTVYWVNLASSIIPASGSLTIYMNFMPANIMSASGPTGEAPQLSALWGQYDNGANVFEIYTNWAGSSLPSGWIASSSGASFSVNNGLTCNGAGGSVFIYYNTPQNPVGYVMDSYFLSGTGASDGHDECIGWGLSPQPSNFTGGNNGWWGWTNGVYAGLYNYQESGGVSSGNVSLINPGNIISTYPITVSLSWQTSASTKAYFNYGSTQTNTAFIPTIANSYPIGGYISSGGTVTYSWWRERLYPPAGIMPNANVQQMSGAALNFDGSNSNYITIPYAEDTTNITHEFWFNTTQVNQGLFEISAPGAFDRDIYLDAGGNVYVYLYQGSTYEKIGSTGYNYADGKWHHIAHVIGAAVGGHRLYIDGNIAASGLLTYSAFNWNTTILLGFSQVTGTYYTGSMDEVRIWNYCRTQCQIRAGMKGELPASKVGLVAYYKFNEGIADGNNSGIIVASDSSGNGNNGTLVGFALQNSNSNWIAPGAITSGIYTNFILGNVTISGLSNVTVGARDTLYASGGGNYVWSTGSTKDTTIVKPSSPATYTVTATDANGCTGTATFTVTTNTTGIATVVNSTFPSIYPNPANDNLKLTFKMQESNRPAIIQVLDITGKEVMNENAVIGNEVTLKLNVAALAVGKYFVRVTAEQETHVLEFIKQ